MKRAREQAENENQEKGYKKALRKLQIDLVKLQQHLIKNNLQIVVVFEGRDGAGKDGVIKRITQHLSPRETRVVALGKPSDSDLRSWYFQRFVAELPSQQEMVLMNRSWYNRAGVEKVMGFCTDHEYENFMQLVLPFEHLLMASGIQVIKYYLDISKKEQQKRLLARKSDPLTQWKISPVDAVALEHWDRYSAARNQMFARTHDDMSPWFIVKSDHKKSARLNVIRHLLANVEWPHKKEHTQRADQNVIFPFHEDHLLSGAIAP